MKQNNITFDGKWNTFLKPTKRHEIPKANVHERGSIIRLLRAFLDMNEDAAELKWGDFGYNSAMIASMAIHCAAERKQFPIKVLCRGERVFFIKRVDKDEKYLLPVSVDDIPRVGSGRRSSWGSTKKVISEFLRSGAESCECRWEEHYKTVSLARGSFYNVIRKYKMPVKVVMRGERLFLVRNDDTD